MKDPEESFGEPIERNDLLLALDHRFQDERQAMLELVNKIFHLFMMAFFKKLIDKLVCYVFSILNA
jgi:hypothetical protein